ncbi:hypothetical protein SCP_0505910 [Sparassis crispa]|uniref:DNA-directed RNA polymerase III subunit rpc6 n=1 Tax=Sparassis crispa TaxID=139825 RepID=A0A401GMT1_9APHY|nr:hypothetical protein SCP_0505910 [Sparassis crispa]GBE83537.1 hypothetical protein SCP_0505910 [Sparassis crispa]
MSGRKPNALEQKLHQAALADSKKTLSQKECETLIPDKAARVEAINFLLGTGMFKALKDTKGALSFRAVMKKELEVKKDMSDEESMVLSHIQASGNEGIWTKHLKAKTELHQTVIDRCIKSLVQKQLIKAVKSVKYPTRKIYMLFHLDPSVEMTGGPWYTDNELDTEFIKLLCSACLRFIRDRSLPKHKSQDGDSKTSQPLFPISAAPSYPTAQQILAFLSKSRITETQLDVEHIEMLLNVLVLDGEVEKVPAFGAVMWEANVAEEREDESDDDGTRSSKKRKREDTDSRKRKRSKRSKSDSESNSNSDSERERNKSKKRRQKRRESDSDDGEFDRKGKKKKRKTDESDEEDGGSSSSEDEKHRRKKKGKKRKESSDRESGDSSDASPESEKRRSRKSSRSKSKSRKHSSSPAPDLSSTSMVMEEDYGAYVYRAIKQEKVGFGLSQAPCVRCPTFDFCKNTGPVNPKECVYYGKWLTTIPVARE